MKKRLLSTILAAGLLVGLLPGAAFAEEPTPTAEPTGLTATPESAATPTAEPTEAPAATASPAPAEIPGGPQTLDLDGGFPDTRDLPDDAELYAGYVRSVLYSHAGVALLRSGNLGADLAETDPLAYRMYSTVQPLIAEVAAGRLASTKFPVDIEDFAISVDETGVDRLQNARDKALELLLLNYPYELYWFNKTPAGGGLYLGGTTDEENHYFEEVVLRFNVSEDYKGQDINTVDTEKTGAASAVVAEAQRVVDENADKTDYQKLVAYKDYICDHVSYNHHAMDDDVPYGDPCQIIYVFDNDPTTNVICEGYAKAFQYLCDLSAFTQDIACYNIPGEMDGGTGAGGHLWNIVTIEGKSYLADLTNCDADSVGAFGGLFLAGTTRGSVNGGYFFYLPAYDTTIYFKYDQSTIDTFPTNILTLESGGYVPAEQDAEASFARYNRGENGWFTGLAMILAPEGYKIGRTGEDTTLTHLNITANGNVEYYLKNIATGAVLGPKTILVKYDADKPTTPVLTVSTEATETTVTLAAAATDATSGIRSYTLAEKGNKIAPQTRADGVFALTGLTTGTTYSFTVTAKDNAGNGSEASEVCAVTPEKEVQPTPTPTPALTPTVSPTAAPAATPTPVADTTPGRFTVNAWVDILAGGTVSPMGATTYTEGQKLTYTITPAPGYRIAKVTVDGVDVGAVSSYTFNALNRNHEIGAYFEKAATKAVYTGTIPATGDEAPLTLWYALAALAAAALCALPVVRRKKSR